MKTNWFNKKYEIGRRFSKISFVFIIDICNSGTYWLGINVCIYGNNVYQIVFGFIFMRFLVTYTNNPNINFKDGKDNYKNN